MNVGTGTEKARFLFWECINSIFGTVQHVHLLALAVLGHVGIAGLCVDSSVVLDVLEGLVHQTPEAAIVTLHRRRYHC
jgi:hypothetical protein